MPKREWWDEDDRQVEKAIGNPYANSRRWRSKSKAFRKRNAFCEVWLAFGRHVKSDVVDHIIRIEDGGSFWDERNYMAMSHFWHNKKRGMESRGLKMRRTKGRGGWIPLDREEIITRFYNEYKNDFDL